MTNIGKKLAGYLSPQTKRRLKWSSLRMRLRLRNLFFRHNNGRYELRPIYFLIASILFLLYVLSPKQPVRYAVFAGYNADGIIPPYVITYLKGLNQVADGVVYITDSPLKEGEEKKIKNLTIYNEHIRHGEYDWGSYKRGYNWLKTNGYLDTADELIFANDSSYAPLKSFKPMFAQMAKITDLDFWGVGQNTAFTTHLQSYFLVFRRRVLRSKAFAMFINNVKAQPDHSLFITEYEVRLTPFLNNLGYIWDSYLPYEKMGYLELTDKNSYPLTLIKEFNHQFIKRRTFTEKLDIREDRDELLRYLKRHYPKRYEEIKADINPHLIPEDLRDEEADK